MNLIGIAGGSGSGKTTFANKVIKRINSSDISILHMDSYYQNHIPESISIVPGKPNFDHPEAFDWPLLSEHLQTLKDGKSIYSPTYDFVTSTRKSELRKVNSTSVVILEGIFSLYDKSIREMLSIKCFLHVDADIRFTRRLDRDVNERGRSLESVIRQYYDTVRPMHQKFLEPQKQYADFTVGEETDTAADILAAKIKEMIH